MDFPISMSERIAFSSFLHFEASPNWMGASQGGTGPKSLSPMAIRQYQSGIHTVFMYSISLQQISFSFCMQFMASAIMPPIMSFMPFMSKSGNMPLPPPVCCVCAGKPPGKPPEKPSMPLPLWVLAGCCGCCGCKFGKPPPGKPPPPKPPKSPKPWGCCGSCGCWPPGKPPPGKPPPPKSPKSSKPPKGPKGPSLPATSVSSLVCSKLSWLRLAPHRTHRTPRPRKA
mmetsp:Transcript_26884/g.43486  ORF Transcript_26884/g.43486 Transcript_26884/m.43486 type:complete len:227 (+) Transcript_26884:858-1538(+)